MHPGPFQSLMQATACFAAAKDRRHKQPRAALQATTAVSLCSISALVLLATSALAPASAYAQTRPGVAAPAVVKAPARPAPATASVPSPVAPAASSPYDAEVASRLARFEKEAVAAQSPAAVIPLLGTGDLWEQVDDRAALSHLIETAAKPRPTLSPLVRAIALFMQRGLLLHQGKAEAAVLASIKQELGVVSTFAVLGPFDNDGRRGHSSPYPPEQETTAPTRDAEYAGKTLGQPLHWRTIPEAALTREGSVPLDSWLRPEAQGTAYAVAYVKSEQQQRVAVRVGSTGALKVWVNQGTAPVLDRDVYHPLRLDQEVGGAVLLAGWNRILVKVSNQEGRWSFLLRLTTPEGRPLAGITTSATPPTEKWQLPRGIPYSGAAPASLLASLRARVPKLTPGAKGPPTGAQAQARAQALLDLGLYLHYMVPFDPETREDETVLSEAVALQPTRHAYRLLALATGEVNRQRRAVEAGLQLPGDTEPKERARLQLELGRIYEEGSRQRQAEQAYQQAVSLDPSLYTASLQLLLLQASRGLPAEALRQLRTLRTQHRALRLLRAHAELLGRVGRHAESELLYSTILTESRDDSDAHRQLLARARARGETEAALRWLDKIEQLSPDAIWPRRERAELLEASGQLEAALVVSSDALTQLGGDAEWHERRGRLLQRLGRTELAQTAYQRALELHPQNPALRQHLLYMNPQGRSSDDLARNFRVPMETLLALPRPEAKAGDAARVLLDQKVTRVHNNGLTEVYKQRAIEILDERGATDYDEFDIRYTPDTQSVQIKSAKLYKKSGEVQQSVAQDESNVSEPWYGLYYDVHAQTVRFTGLVPGDVVTIEYVLADVGRRNLLSDYFGDVHFMQEEIPVLDARYTLVLPQKDLQERPLYFNELPSGKAGIDGVEIKRTDELKGADHLIKFVSTNVPRLRSEPGMPGITEVIPYIHVSTYKSWEDVATWYRGLVSEQLQPSAEIAQAAKAAVAAANLSPGDELGKLRAIYNEVVRRTRYVGLEFGIHGYKPYKVAQVFQRKFGDCKDKASLLKVMLKEVGIDSSLVLARTRRNGQIAPEPASLSVFDHAIVYVPKFDLYLDGTAEFSGSTELPAQDQDIMVLVVEDPRAPYKGQGHLTKTPVLPAAQSLVNRQLQVQLQPSGAARVVEHIEVSGQSAAKWREHYHVAGSQKERYEKVWNDTYPGSKALRVELPSINDLEKAVTLKGELEVPSWGRPQESRVGQSQGKSDLVLRLLGREPDLLRSFARLSQRRYDLILGFPWTHRDQVTVRLSGAQKLRRQPEAKHLESPFGRFDLQVETKQVGGATEVTVRAELRIDRHRITQAEYAAFRSFCTDVDSAISQQLVVGE